jgi:hypothetical protein
MYLHSVMAKESLLNHQVSSVGTEAPERSGSTDSEGIARILQNLINRDGVSKVVDANGEPLVVTRSAWCVAQRARVAGDTGAPLEIGGNMPSPHCGDCSDPRKLQQLNLVWFGSACPQGGL